MVVVEEVEEEGTGEGMEEEGMEEEEEEEVMAVVEATVVLVCRKLTGNENCRI